MKQQILIIEDSTDDRELLRRQLVKFGLKDNILFLSSAEKALVVLEELQKEDSEWSLLAIFLDIKLPGINGIEFLRRLRLNEKFSTVPVIVMTVSDDPRHSEECQQLKVASYVYKPVTFAAFTKAVANIFHPPELAKSSVG